MRTQRYTDEAINPRQVRPTRPSIGYQTTIQTAGRNCEQFPACAARSEEQARPLCKHRTTLSLLPCSLLYPESMPYPPSQLAGEDCAGTKHGLCTLGNFSASLLHVFYGYIFVFLSRRINHNSTGGSCGHKIRAVRPVKEDMAQTMGEQGEELEKVWLPCLHEGAGIFQCRKVGAGNR